MRIPSVLTIVASLVLGACATDPADDTEDLGEADQAVTTSFANDKPAFDYFIGKGLTNFQAAGIVGNLDQESGVNPSSVQSGGPGRGIAQWSVGGRWDTTGGGKNVLAYAAAHGENPRTLQAQLEFIWLELTTVGYGYTELKATTNVTDATVAFMAKYEICGNCIQTQRVNFAKAVLAAYGAIPYGGSFVSQTWPLASAPALQVKCGESIDATIVLKNTGTKPWTTATHLGTTAPRDRASIFAGSGWTAPNRPAAITGTVAPGANGTFKFSFNGPTGAACVPGTYKEYFGVVQEGGSWFSDAGNSGPADDQIEALIELVPGDGAGSNAGSNSGSNSGSDGGPGADGGGCNVVGGGRSAVGGVMAAMFVAVARRKRRTVRG
ncbi:hypothetical protein BH11MYX1_BH11MYX1_39740 [soil metagenome]